jgi:hypothetical protein
LAVAAITTFVVLPLAGCAPQKPSVIQTDIDSQLKSQASSPEAVVDLSSIPGDWQRALLVCRGANRQMLDAALGFSWEKAPDPSAPGFLGLIVLASSTKVTDSFLAGLDQDRGDVTHWYFAPCPDDATYRQTTVPIVDRLRPELRFERLQQHKFVYWAVPASELASLPHASVG